MASFQATGPPKRVSWKPFNWGQRSQSCLRQGKAQEDCAALEGLGNQVRWARGAWRGPCFLRLSDAHPAPKKTYQQGLAGTSGRSSKGQGVRIGGQEGRRHSEAASAPAPLLSSRPHGWPRRDSGTGPCPSAPARIKEKHREVSQGENTGNLAFVFKNRAKQLNYVIKSVKCYLWSTSGFFLKCWLFDWI